jgi:ABC-type Fe3+-hydroxamate transport system substrate-binding protein
VTLIPQRIISLVPSKTELLFDLGLDAQVVGITKFCIHPDHWFRSKTRIGGTKNVKLESIASLNPDLIIANKEENTKEDIEWLSERFNVYMSDITTVDDALIMIEKVGDLTHTRQQADSIIAAIRHERSVFAREGTSYGSVVYLIWREPMMAAANHTFINAMLKEGGWDNALEDDFSRYPEVTWEDLVSVSPQYVFLSSEPFPFKDKHIAEIRERLPYARVMLVDGEMFSWYGSRMIKAFEYFDTIRKPSF